MKRYSIFASHTSRLLGFNLLGSLFLGSLLLGACGKSEAPKDSSKESSSEKEAAEDGKKAIDPAILGLFAPLPEVKVPGDDDVVAKSKFDLGRMLYYEARLSKNHDISCNSCHELNDYGVDGKPTSPGHKEALGDRNSPTVYNAAVHTMQFWDGRAKDVEEQATGPILNPVEMALENEGQVVAVLTSMPEYVELFKKAFPDAEEPITLTNVGNAIGYFERSLLTPSHWDEFLQGKEDALSDAEKEGLRTFVATGCTTCHTGVGLGGHMFQKAGLVTAWPNQDDKGRFDVTKDETDSMFFKVPGLRNILKTGPYFHDGSVDTIEEAITLMGRHQLGKEIAEDDVAKIVTFLGALTGELPSTEIIGKPELPESTDSTPEPDPS